MNEKSILRYTNTQRSSVPRPSSGIFRPVVSNLPRPVSCLPRPTANVYKAVSYSECNDAMHSVSDQRQPSVSLELNLNANKSGICSSVTDQVISSSRSHSHNLWHGSGSRAVPVSVPLHSYDRCISARDPWSFESTFSKELAKYTTTNNRDDLWEETLQENFSKKVQQVETFSAANEETKILRFSLGKKVVIGGEEEGILRYYGRTAFSSGNWCGIELDRPLGKNDGSVDGVIYFKCRPFHGIFAPESKIVLVEEHDIVYKAKYQRFSDPTELSKNPEGYFYREHSPRRYSSEIMVDNKAKTLYASSTESFCGSYHESSAMAMAKEKQGSGSFSPLDATFDDSSLGILNSDQMSDFAVPSLPPDCFPSDDDIEAIEDDIYESECCAGSSIVRWDSQDHFNALEGDLLKKEVSSIIQEISRRGSEVSSSSSSSPSRSITHEESLSGTHANAEICENDILETVIEDNNVIVETKTIMLQPKSDITVTFKHDSPEIKLIDSIGSLEDIQTKADNVESTTMTCSAASLDQGYQGDGEFDAPSEIGSITACSPTEYQAAFTTVDVSSITVDSTPATEMDVSLVDDDIESESSFTPRDRTARIIDGKLYHNNKELAIIRYQETKMHDQHGSEMDSSGFYSDLDPREEDTTKIDFPALQPLTETFVDGDIYESALEGCVRKEVQEENKEGNYCISKEESFEDKAITKPTKELAEKLECCTDRHSDNESLEPISQTNMQPTQALKSRSYEKPWLSRPPPYKGKEKTKKDISNTLSLPMPKKDVPSKLKAMLENQDTVSEPRPKVAKKGKWDDVMDKIAKGQKEKPRLKNIKSRLLDNVKQSVALSPQAEKIRQDRRERREKREKHAAAIVYRRLDSDRKMSGCLNLKYIKSEASSLEFLNEGSYNICGSNALFAPSKQEIYKADVSKAESLRTASPSCYSESSGSSEVRSQTSNTNSASTKICPASDINGQQSFGGPCVAPCKRGNKEKKYYFSETGTASLRAQNDHQKSSNPLGVKKISDPGVRRPRLEIKSTIPKVQRAASKKYSDPVKPTRPSQAPPSREAETLKRLEAELVARVSDAAAAKEEAHFAMRGMEALTVLVSHLSNQYEAFSTPKLKTEIDRLRNRLTEARLSLDESSATIQRLHDTAEDARQLHAEQLRGLENELQRQLSELKGQLRSDLKTAQETYHKELTTKSREYKIRSEELATSHQIELERLEADWRTKLNFEHEKQTKIISDLEDQHVAKIQELECASQARESALKEANELLLLDQERLKEQQKKLEETLLSDKDHRLQAAKRVCSSLQKEVDSLKAVVEIRNSEIHSLRGQVHEMGYLKEALEFSRERVRSLQAKIEDLQAQMQKRADEERNLIQEHGLLVDNFHKETCENKRLTLENEELQWKLRQRDSVLNTSVPTLSLVTQSLARRQQEGGNSPAHVPPLSPRLGRGSLGDHSPQVRRHWCPTTPVVPENREANLSFDSPPPSPRVKGIIEKSNSVSFILDLDDSEVPSSTNSRKTVQRASSFSMGQTKGKKAAAGYKKYSEIASLANGKQYSSSESSKDGENERNLHKGLAWTVPVHSTPSQPNVTLKHLNDEDEYENYESEFLEVVPLRGNMSPASTLSNVLSHASGSSSDLSHCGGSTSEEESSDGGMTPPKMHQSPRGTNRNAWCPIEGAGEAMITGELLAQYRSHQRHPISSSASEETLSVPKDISWSEDVECDLTSSSEMHEL